MQKRTVWSISLTARPWRPTFISMYGFETVTILTTVGAAVVGAVSYVRSGGPLAQLGRQGTLWFDHAADRPLHERPSEDALDAPIPRRRLRGRAD